jgi:antitoxin MazE
MTVKLQKWGNSMGVRIPKSIIDKVKLEENEELMIEQQDGKIVIFPARKKLSLGDMMVQVTPENLHTEDDLKPDGNEV